MMKFRIKTPSAKLSESTISSSTTSTNLTTSTSTFYAPKNKEKIRNSSLLVEQTGRFGSRRSSVPNEAFISIDNTDNANNLSSVGCVRYHRSTSDLSDDISFDTVSTIASDLGATAFFGQTTQSFLYNGKQLLSQGKRYEINKPTEHLEEPPSYKGFNNFDEISVTEATEEDEDSGLSSLASLGNFRKPIQAFDFSDLGFGRPQRFSLSNLRKNRQTLNRPRGRHKWDFAFQFILAYISYGLGFYSMLALNIQDEAKGSFFLAHVLITMSVGLPLSYLLALIGQFSSLGTVQAYKMVPGALGIGIGLSLIMLLIAVVKSVTVAHAIYYLILAFHRPLPWTICDPEWGANQKCFMECYDKFNCDQEDVTSRPGMQVWHHFVVGRNGSGNVYEEGVSVPKWDLLIALHGVWFLIFLFTFKGMGILSRILYLSGVIPILQLIVLLFWISPLNGTVLIDVLKIDYDHITDINIWMRAAQFSITMIALSIGILTGLASYNRSYDELDKCLGIAVPINIFISWLMLLLNSTLNLNHFNVFDVSDLIFGIIPEQIAQDSEAPSMLAILFFMFILLTSINTVAILSESMISNLQDNFELASKSRLITSSIFCLGSFSMGLFFIVPNGSQLLYNTNYALETASVVYIPFVILAIFSYGLQRWFDNIYILTGSPMYGLTKRYMAFLPVPILPILCSYFNYGPFHPSNNGLAELHVYGLTILLASIPLVYAFLLTTKVTLQNNGSIKTLMVANSSWPQECNERPEFRTVTSSHRDNLRNGTLHYRPEFAMNEINFDDE